MEDYFLHVDDLEEPLRSAAKAVTDPLLEALGDAYATPVDGTAFYALQSCANHSCAPSAHTLKVRRCRSGILLKQLPCDMEHRDDRWWSDVQGREDVDGAAVVTAKRAIRAGEEITISYVDEVAALAEREEALRDYGFTCQCSRCLSERSVEQTH